jgi:hypothetical protein
MVGLHREILKFEVSACFQPENSRERRRIVLKTLFFFGFSATFLATVLYSA